MGKLKVALSVLAALLMAAATVTTISVGAVPGWVPQLFEVGGMVLSWLGVQPWVLPPRVSMIFATLNMMAMGFVGSHAALWGDGRKHVFLLIIAFSGAIFGVLARGIPKPQAPPPSPNP